MRSFEEVEKYFQNQLQSRLSPLETFRKEKVKIIRIYILGTLISLGLMLVTLFVSPPTSVILFLVTCLFAGALRTAIQNLNKQLRKDFKVKILPVLLNYLFDDYTYLPTQRISKSILQQSKIIHGNIAEVEGEDYMCFHLGTTSVHFSEMTAFGFSNKVTFQGIFLSSTFNKHFSAETIVIPRTWSSKATERIRQYTSGLESVALEDPDFNKQYIVLSNDQVEARYILSTSMMKRLLDYQNKTGKKLSFSFTGNLMHCAIPNYINLFEPPLFETFLESGFFQKSYYALKNYTDIVEDLNLNNHIWR